MEFVSYLMLYCKYLEIEILTIFNNSDSIIWMIMPTHSFIHILTYSRIYSEYYFNSLYNLSILENCNPSGKILLFPSFC